MLPKTTNKRLLSQNNHVFIDVLQTKRTTELTTVLLLIAPASNSLNNREETITFAGAK